MVPAATPQAAAVVWEHRMGQPVPERAEFATASVDEVRLRGSLNMPLSPEEQRHLIAEACRVLRPGGKLFVHVLTAEKSIAGDLGLPGPAAYVKHAPLEDVPVRLLEEAGLSQVRMVKFDAQPCFVRQGIGLRELQLEGFKSVANETNGVAEVLYTGPLDRIEVHGVALSRGRRSRVSGQVAQQLRSTIDGIVIFDAKAGEAKHKADCGV
jgi:SAM-dependent methyltransferase